MMVPGLWPHWFSSALVAQRLDVFLKSAAGEIFNLTYHGLLKSSQGQADLLFSALSQLGPLGFEIGSDRVLDTRSVLGFSPWKTRAALIKSAGFERNSVASYQS